MAWRKNRPSRQISRLNHTGKGPDLIKQTLGDPTGLVDRMKAYTHAGGRRTRGLAERRRQEIELFQTP